MGRPKKNSQQPTPEQQLARADFLQNVYKKSFHDIYLIASNLESLCERDEVCVHECKAFFGAIALMAENWSH